MKSSSASTYISRLALSSALGALIAGSAPAIAQEATPDNTAAAQEAGVADIVVTAQRRSESVQRVPISIQVLTSQALDRQQVIDTRDIARISPTVNFSNSAGAMLTTFGLRGITSTATAPGVQPSTAMVVDGVPVYNQGEFVSGLGDLQRVEILNGPQGTLFGKNSTAGVISVTTNKPTNVFEGSLEASQTTDDETYIRGLFNAPLTSGVRLRVTGYYQNLKPQLKNLTGKDGYGQRSYGVRAKLAVDLGSNATFTLAGTYMHSSGSQNQFTVIKPGILNAIATAQGAVLPVGEGGTTVNTDSPTFDIYSSKNVMGTLDWNVSDTFSVTSITNYTDFKDRYALDADGTPFGASIGTGESRPGSTYPFQAQYTGPNYNQHTRYVSQELRGNFKSGSIDAVFGGFYQHVKLDYDSFPPYKYQGFFNPPSGAPAINADHIFSNLTNNTAAVFADLNLAVTHQVKLFGGLRFTHETLDQNYNRDTYFSPYSTFNPVTGVISAAPIQSVGLIGHRTVNNLSGRAGIQYQPTESLNFYGSFARGYKGPAANNNSAVTAANIVLNPETATAFELGFKVRLFDNRLALNAAAFRQKISNLQVSATDPTKNAVATFLQNAGYAISKGIEGDVTFAPVTGLQIGFAGAYVDATYHGLTLPCNSIQTQTGTCPNFNGVVGLQNGDGLRLTHAPKFKYTVSGSYESDISGTDLHFFGQANYVHSGSDFSNADNNPLTLQGAHGSLNTVVGIRTNDGRWEIQLFGKNILDKFYYSSKVVIAPIGQPVGYLPRDYHAFGGLKVIARF